MKQTIIALAVMATACSPDESLTSRCYECTVDGNNQSGTMPIQQTYEWCGGNVADHERNQTFQTAIHWQKTNCK